MGIVFSETHVKPTGRKARVVSDELWEMLADGAKRDISKVAEGTEKEISDLVKDLGSAAVRKRYDITVGTEGLETGDVRLTFYPVAKPEPSSTTEPSSPAGATAEPSSPAGATAEPSSLGEHRQGKRH